MGCQSYIPDRVCSPEVVRLLLGSQFRHITPFPVCAGCAQASAESPAQSAATSQAPAPAQLEGAAAPGQSPDVGSSGSASSDSVGSLLQPLLSGIEGIFAPASSGNSNGTNSVGSGSGLAGLLG